MASLASPIRPLLVLLLLVPAVHAHGGFYRGPAASGPPNGMAPLAPGTGPSGPGALPGTAAAGLGPDLLDWGLWWRLNQWRFLEIKKHVHSAGPGSGAEGWFLGQGQRPQALSLRPSEAQIRQQIVPALLAVLEQASDSDLKTGVMIALAKIGNPEEAGDAARDRGGLLLEPVLTAFLDEASQEVRETAAIALGLLASPRAVPSLAHLLWDTAVGRRLVGERQVDARTRAFAAYGLGLTGARCASETERRLIVSMLRTALEQDDTRTRDLSVACVIALGLVPLETPGDEPEDGPRARDLAPEASRRAQVEYLLRLLRDEKARDIVRAQCPIAMARLLEGLGGPARDGLRARLAEDLIERLERDKDDDEILRGSIVALGVIGTNDGDDALDGRIRRTLAAVPRRSNDMQARAFALIAMAEVGARFGGGRPGPGIGEARDFLVQQLTDGKNALEPWAALAIGVLARGLRGQPAGADELTGLQRILRRLVEDEGAAERLGAFALAAGLAGSLDSARRLETLVEKSLPEESRGQVALGLGLLQRGQAVECLSAIVADARYRPRLLAQASIALGLLGDKRIGVLLVDMLRSARSLAAQSAIASALGVIGDRQSVEPLLELLGDRLATDKARAFAAVALGNVADKELLPWNSKIGADLNYRAAPASLFDPASGKGILDIW